ncbi:multicopper oxidase family protein [Streptomyces sp. NPDC050085]|uniref:multicopper oxidase family protein n=1 Tax=Streptomyces sp. NPDC050085 TaxID=3365600 RepID=UPI00378AC468
MDRKPQSRTRHVFLVLGVLVLAVALVRCTGVASSPKRHGPGAGTAGPTATIDRGTFRHRLRVPPLASSYVDEKSGRRVFELRAGAGRTQFLPGEPTPTWGYDGSFLGPTLRAERGERVEVRFRNALDEPTTLHWHGMQLPARMDGSPHQTVAPGGSWTPYWKVDQPAATLWYHPHPMGGTEGQVARGLAGMFLVDDARSERLALPKRYGVDDLPVIVQDVRFDGAKLDFGHGSSQYDGFLGDRTLANGTLDPYEVVHDERVRLRLLNASTERTYDFGFTDSSSGSGGSGGSGGRDFAVVGTDGGLLERPATVDRIRLSPGERAEVVVRMAPGERTVLRSFPPARDGDVRHFPGGGDSFDVLQLRAAATLRHSPELPSQLGELKLPEPGDAVRGRYFDLGMGKINDRRMDMDRVDDVVTRGTTEVWTVHNGNGTPHNFHVHGVQFRVVSVDGREPPPELRGRKDTVFVPGDASVRLALRFDGGPEFADPHTPYMYHCHLLWHEDMGMMGQFVVVDRGQGAEPMQH